MSLKRSLFIISCILVNIIDSESVVICDDCKFYGDTLEGYLVTEISKAEQTQMIIENLCPGASNVTSCATGIRNWWAAIADVMYPQFFNGQSVCFKLGVCPDKNATWGTAVELTDPNCSPCTDYMDNLAELLNIEQTTIDIMTFLSGAGFCGQTSDPVYCAEAINTSMPQIIPIISNNFSQRKVEYCCSMSDGQVCTDLCQAKPNITTRKTFHVK